MLSWYLPGAGDAVLAVHRDDLVVQGGVHRQHVAAVDGEAVLVDVHDVDVLGEVGEVDRALPVSSASGRGPRRCARARVRWPLLWYSPSNSIEPLVGDHGALAGEDVVVAAQGDPQQLRVLQAVAVLGLRLGVGEKRALHDVSRSPSAPDPEAVGAVLAGLDDDDALAGEGHLVGLAAAPADQRLTP